MVKELIFQKLIIEISVVFQADKARKVQSGNQIHKEASGLVIRGRVVGRFDGRRGKGERQVTPQGFFFGDKRASVYRMGKKTGKGMRAMRNCLASLSGDPTRNISITHNRSRFRVVVA